MPIHVIAVTVHNKPPHQVFLAQFWRVTNGVPTSTYRSLYRTSKKMSLWKGITAGKVLCVSLGCWVAGGKQAPSPFMISQLIILFSMLMNH